MEDDTEGDEQGDGFARMDARAQKQTEVRVAQAGRLCAA